LPLLLQRFRPITVEKPKVLLPLVNAPLLEYTLEWLALNQVEEVRCGEEC
jgi:translation initiation factor eIF-2B subunit epsilon